MPVEPVADESGFTLIEALFAMLILIVGLVAVTNLMIIGASSNSVANQSSATTGLATEEMEKLKAIPFTSLSTGGNLTLDAVDSSGANAYRDDSVDGVGPIHTRWVITSISNQTRFIEVVSEPAGGFMKSRARADFSTFRTCTAVPLGCPAAP
jgi:type II secretory pathway pseudopilin PulG